MGYLTILLACALVSPAWGGSLALDPDMAELVQAIRTECLAESGASAALVASISEGADLSPDAALKCYIKCTMITAGMMNDGVVDVEAIAALLPDSLRDGLESTVRKCGTQPGADQCDVAYNTQVCWQKSSKDAYFLI